MPVPSTIADLSTTANSNSPASGEAVGPNLDNYLRAHAAIIKTEATDLADGTSATKGSSKVGYFPAGTGAVARTVQAKLRESVSVKDFGAVGDGVTDDTAAIQAAIDAVYTAGGGEVLLSGKHLVSDEITLKDRVWIVGRGFSLNATDYFTTYGDGLFLASNAGLGSNKCVVRGLSANLTGRRHEGGLRNLYIHGNGDTNSGTGGVWADGTRLFSVDGCLVVRCSGAAIRAISTAGTPNGLFVKNGTSVRFCYSHAIQLVGGEHFVENSYIGNNDGVGVYINSGSTSVVGCTIADHGNDGVYILSANGVVISGNIIQDNDKNGIEVDSSGDEVKYITITGNSIYDNGINEDSLSGPYDATNRSGIRWNTGTTLRSVISGNSIGNRRLAADSEHPIVSPSQQYGIYFNSSSTRVKGAGNIFAQNVTQDVRKAAAKNFGIEIQANGDAYTLHHYEEGTYLPELLFGGAATGITYGTQQGTWVRVGNMITVNCSITLTSKGSATGSATVSIPVTPSAQFCGLSFRANSLAAGVGTSHLQGLINSGGSSIGLGRLTGGSNAALTDADFGNTSSITFNFSYFV